MLDMKNEMATFNTAIYVRLSKEDVLAAQTGRESNSITNQKQLILDFLKDKPEFNIVSIRIDDGYTGTNYDRPAFQRMLDDIKAGRVNCVVVKDLSRFGREYINAGKYIHRLFPVLGVRLIAVNDNIDTYTRDDSSEFSITLKNLMNDNYSRDISIKIRSQLDVKRKHGDFVGPFAAYGYRKCEDDHNRIEADPYAASIVQDIFDWKINGMTNQGIADELNSRNILSPLEYKRSIGQAYYSGFKQNQQCLWTAQAVRKILSNPLYIGTLRQGIRRRPNYKIRKSVIAEEREWIVIQNAHEAIISELSYGLAQKALQLDTRSAPGANCVYPLSGLIECGKCGAPIVRDCQRIGEKTYGYYRCRSQAGEQKCSLKKVRQNSLEESVLEALRQHVQTIIQLDELITNIQSKPFRKITVEKCEMRREKLESEISRYRDLKASLYEDMKDGLISKNDFCEIRGQYDVRIADALIAEEQIDRELELYLTDDHSVNRWMKEFMKHRDITEVTRIVALECIKKIVIDEQYQITITFEHQQEFERIMQTFSEFCSEKERQEAI